MKKKLFISFIFYLIFNSFFTQTLSYDNFDGRYGYETWNTSNVNMDYDENEEILLIVDYSGSMNGRIGYTSKLILTIDAIRDLLYRTNPNAKIGLRLFGFSEKSYIAKDMNSLYEKEICSASKLLVPIAPNNSETIIETLNQYSSRGATPIGYSLRQAVQFDFSPDASIKHIILITDGVETCGDDPCLFIRNLMRIRNDIKIDVIGITLDENQYSRLRCISDSAKGKFYNINNIDDFNIVFTKVLTDKPPVKRELPKTKPDITKKIKFSPVSNISYKNYLFEFAD